MSRDAFTDEEWDTLRNALDEWWYQVDHTRPGIRRETRQRRTQRRLEQLQLLRGVDANIAEATGLPPLFGD